MMYPYDNLISIIFKEAYVSFLLRARSKATRSCYPLLLSSGYFLYKDMLKRHVASSFDTYHKQANG